jgi:hypothetical protein
MNVKHACHHISKNKHVKHALLYGYFLAEVGQGQNEKGLQNNHSASLVACFFGLNSPKITRYSMSLRCCRVSRWSRGKLHVPCVPVLLLRRGPCLAG